MAHPNTGVLDPSLCIEGHTQDGTRECQHPPRDQSRGRGQSGRALVPRVSPQCLPPSSSLHCARKQEWSTDGSDGERGGAGWRPPGGAAAGSAAGRARGVPEELQTKGVEGLSLQPGKPQAPADGRMDRRTEGEQQPGLQGTNTSDVSGCPQGKRPTRGPGPAEAACGTGRLGGREPKAGSARAAAEAHREDAESQAAGAWETRPSLSPHRPVVTRLPQGHRRL